MAMKHNKRTMKEGFLAIPELVYVVDACSSLLTVLFAFASQ